LPAKRLSRRKLKEVLRLHFDLGLGQRQIARSCAIGRGTVYEYLKLAQAAGLTCAISRSLAPAAFSPRAPDRVMNLAQLTTDIASGRFLSAAFASNSSTWPSPGRS
jgi:hypothetical protein